MSARGLSPLIVCSQRIRPVVKKLLSRVLPDLTVISYEEIPADVILETVAAVDAAECERAMV